VQLKDGNGDCANVSLMGSRMSFGDGLKEGFLVEILHAAVQTYMNKPSILVTDRTPAQLRIVPNGELVNNVLVPELGRTDITQITAMPADGTKVNLLVTVVSGLMTDQTCHISVKDYGGELVVSDALGEYWKENGNFVVGVTYLLKGVKASSTGCVTLC